MANGSGTSANATDGTAPGAAALAAMLSLVTLIGSVAAFCTAISNLPQVIKAWRTHSVGDLSLKMILLLSTGLALWIVYGVMKGDLVIIAANVASLLLAVNLLVFKLKEMRGEAGGKAAEPTVTPR